MKSGVLRLLGFLLVAPACVHYGRSFLPRTGEYREVAVSEVGDGGVLVECAPVFLISDLHANLSLVLRGAEDAGVLDAVGRRVFSDDGDVLDEDGAVLLPRQFRAGSSWSVKHPGQSGCELLSTIQSIETLEAKVHLDILRSLRCGDVEVEVTRERWVESRGAVAIRLLGTGYGRFFERVGEGASPCPATTRLHHLRLVEAR